MTTPVAAPRFIRSPNLATAGSIAIAANHAMSRVKITEPPSSSTNHRNAPSAMTAPATSPVRQTLPGSKVTDVRGRGSATTAGVTASTGVGGGCSSDT